VSRTVVSNELSAPPLPMASATAARPEGGLHITVRFPGTAETSSPR
jgi:hypothetical protein